MDHSAHDILANRLREIDAAISSLENERNEIKVALSVVARYVTTPNYSASASTVERKGDTDEPATGTPRPDGIPTLWKMAHECLLSRQSVTAAELVEFIDGKYWPGVVHAQIGPSLYRFVNEGRLEKVGRGEFSLPTKENEPPSDGSETEEGATSSELSGGGVLGNPPAPPPDPSGQTRRW